MHSVLLIASLILTTVVLYTVLNRIFPLKDPISPERLRRGAGILLLIFVATVGYPWNIIENWEGVRLEYGDLDPYSIVNLWSYPLQGAIFGIAIALFLFMNRSSFAARLHRSDEQTKEENKKATRRSRIIFSSVIVACISTIAVCMATAPPPAGLPAPTKKEFLDIPWEVRQAVYTPLAAESLAERFPDYSNLKVLVDSHNGYFSTRASVLFSFDAKDDNGNDRHFLSSGIFDPHEQEFMQYSVAYSEYIPPQYNFNDAFSVQSYANKNSHFPHCVNIKGEILDESVANFKLYYIDSGTRKTEIFPLGTSVYKNDYDGMGVTQEFGIDISEYGFIFRAAYTDQSKIDVTRIEALDDNGAVRGFVNFQGLTRSYTHPT